MKHQHWLLTLAITLAGMTTACSPASAAPPPPATSPILQIDSGGHMAKIRDVIFTKDGRYLVSASDDKTVRVWDVLSGKTVRIIRGRIGEGDEGKIYATALSPDNNWLAVGGSPPRWGIRLLDFQTGQVVRLLKGHENVILSLAFSQDNRLLISGSGDNTAYIWDAATGQSLHHLQGHSDNIYAVAFSPDSRLAATGSLDHTLKLWQVSDGKLIATMEGHADDVVSAVFTPDGKYILSGSCDKTIRLWDGKTGQFIKEMAKQETIVGSLSVSPDGKSVLTGSSYDYGHPINNIFAIPSGQRISHFDKHDNIVLSTAISPDGKTAATGGGIIWLWDIQTGREKIKMAGSGRSVWSVGFSEDGHKIAWGNTFNQTGYSSFQINGPLEKSFIIDANAGEPEPGSNVSSDTGYVRVVEKKGDVSVRTKDGEIHPTLQILRNGEVEHEITRDSTPGFDHRSFTLTPDSETVISGGMNGALAAFDTQTGKEQRQYIGHTSDVWAVAVSPDGRLLVSGSADQTVRLWEVETGKLLMTLFYGDDGEWVAWTSEGFFTASGDGAKYIGYHINRGVDRQADYITVEQVYDLFYRPDLV
ncbi:MAG TPA: WD40 repeat domain-containing protein, partial [Thermodesulfovibrionia bacterium]|nr:WD40 repeat domain-containing protein [Thermodesulfovibrionia bacterium]